MITLKDYEEVMDSWDLMKDAIQRVVTSTPSQISQHAIDLEKQMWKYQDLINKKGLLFK